jgi:F-type H+-transporting ATPase subunit O
MLRTGRALNAGRLSRALCTAASEYPTTPPKQVFGIAGRYASALYSAAAKTGGKTPLEVQADLNAFYDATKASPALYRFVVDPAVSRETKSKAIVDMLTAAKAGETTKNGMATLAEGGRMAEFGKMIELYNELMDAAKGETTAVVTSAQPLEAKEVKELEEGLKSWLDEGQSKVTIVTKTDPTLVAGMTIEMGEKFMDLSVYTQLKKLDTLLREGTSARPELPADFSFAAKEKETYDGVNAKLLDMASQPPPMSEIMSGTYKPGQPTW